MVASVLHLGNVRFGSDSTGQAVLNNNAELCRVSDVRNRHGRSEVSGHFSTFHLLFSPLQLLGVDALRLQEGLMFRKIEARTDQVRSGSNTRRLRDICQ